MEWNVCDKCRWKGNYVGAIADAHSDAKLNDMGLSHIFRCDKWTGGNASSRRTAEMRKNDRIDESDSNFPCGSSQIFANLHAFCLCVCAWKCVAAARRTLTTKRISLKTQFYLNKWALLLKSAHRSQLNLYFPLGLCLFVACRSAFIRCPCMCVWCCKMARRIDKIFIKR